MPTKRKVNPKDAIARLKVPIGMYPNAARIEAALVFAQVASDYGAFNWRNVEVRLSTYLDAIDRHLVALRSGQDNDPESGRPHAAHINACTAILLEAQALRTLVDDRFENDPSAALLASLIPSEYHIARRRIKPRPARYLMQIRRAKNSR